MGIKRHRPELIVTRLRKVKALYGLRMECVDATREVPIADQTFYGWRKQNNGMGTDQLKEAKRPQKVNDRLRRAVAGLPCSGSASIHAGAVVGWTC